LGRPRPAGPNRGRVGRRGRDRPLLGSPGQAGQPSDQGAARGSHRSGSRGLPGALGGRGRERGLAVVRTEALKGETTVLEPTRAERAIARRNAETRATVPDLELGTEVEIDPALAAAGASLTAVLVRACALALRDHPRANAAYRDGHYELYSRVNVAVT